MSVATVYHANTDEIRAAGRSGFSGEGIWPEEFTPVATVDVGEDASYWCPQCRLMVALDCIHGRPENALPVGLGVVFEKTNHIDCAWWDNDGVERIGPETRSTSVGDVVVLDGMAYACRSAGWALLGPFEVAL